MKAYEITCIVRPDLDEEQTRGTAEFVARRIQQAGGEIIAVYPWSPARRRLAYPVREYGDGFYFSGTFRIDPQEIRNIENTYRLQNNILRYLIVEASEGTIRQSQQRALQTAQAPGPQGQQQAQPQPIPAQAQQVSAPAQQAPEPQPQPAPAPETDATPAPEPVTVASTAAPNEE